MTTSVNVSVKLTINDQPITLSSQDVGTGGIVFSLPQPVTLGTPGDFLDWFNRTFGVTKELPNKDDDAIKNLPTGLQNALDDLLNHDELVLDTLVIDTVHGLYQFGISMQLDPAVTIISGLEFDGMGFFFERRANSSLLQGDMKKEAQTLSVTAGDGAKFKKDDVIQIDSEKMTVQSVDTDQLTVSRTTDNAQVAEHVASTVVINLSS